MSAPADFAAFETDMRNHGARIQHVEVGAVGGKTTFEGVIDNYDAAAKTISGHFSVSGKDDSGRPEAITDGHFSAVPVSAQ